MIFFNNTSNLSIPYIVEASGAEGAVLLIDKPKTWTSFDVVAKIRSLTRIKKIGHAGTLDPLATGLLIVCIGRKATKEIDTFQNDRKTYLAEFKFGASTKTFDSEMEEENCKDTSCLNLNDIQEKIKKYIGNIEQIPPVFSAKKIDGVSAYKSARQNKVVEMKPTNVTIYNYEIIEFNNPFLKVKIHCSKGTYIRSLANDLGKDLGVGAYLSNLRRTEIGNFSVYDAMPLLEFIENVNKTSIPVS